MFTVVFLVKVSVVGSSSAQLHTSGKMCFISRYWTPTGHMTTAAVILLRFALVPKLSGTTFSYVNREKERSF
jgi:hypothetical protein